MKSKTRLISERFIMKTFVLFSFLVIFSCSQNETQNDVEKLDNKDMNFDNLRIDLGDWKIKTDSIILFQANNVEELNNHLNTSLTYFIEGLDEIVRTNDDVDLYEFNLQLHQGQALITDIYFYNSERQEFVDIFENGNAPDCISCNIKNVVLITNSINSTGKNFCVDSSCVVQAVSNILLPNKGTSFVDISLHISRSSKGISIQHSKEQTVQKTGN